MKKTLLIVAAAVALVLTGCAEMGLDGSILERIEDIENRLDEVETLVNADKNGLTITSVQEVAEGYLIIFSDGSSVTVKHGKDGADGKDGQDGEDGKDGQDGENGSAGENGSNGSCIITSVEIGADSVTFNLSDGRVVVIPLQEGAVTPVNPSLSISFDYSHIDVVMPYQEYSIPYTVESKSDYVNVEAFSSNSYFMVVTTIPDEEDNKKGTINFLLLEDMSDLLGDTEIDADLLESIALESRITVLATDGKSVIMETIKLENGVLVGPNYDARQIIVEGEGGVIQLPFFTNVKCDVKFYNQDDYNEEEVDWLTLVEDTRAIEEKTLNVQVAKNNTGVARRARVWIYSGNIEEDTEFGISYYIYQNASTEDVAVNEITWTVGYNGGYFEGYELPFELVSYGGYMSCEESCNWLSCSLYGYDGYFNYIEVDYNDTNDERTATITVQEDSYRYEYSDEYGEVVSREVEVTTNIITVVQRPSLVKATVAEFLAAAEDETIYELTGEITRVVNTTYGNFDITDETGTVYVYGLLSPEGESKVQWAAAGLKEGDIITIQGTRSSYNGNAQMKNAKYISHIPEGVSVIYYTTTDGEIVTLYDETAFDATIVSNTYENGVGMIVFDSELTTTGFAPFALCENLATITIPQSVTEIGESFCIGCPNLWKIESEFATEDGRCLIVNGVLNSFAPAGLTEYTIPDSVTSIGSNAFFNCSSLASITIPDSVTSIGYNAFYNCSSLASVTLPDSVTEIGHYAFEYCSSLASVTIPDSVTSIGYYAFADCYALENIDIPESVTEIYPYAFASSGLTSIDLPDNLTYLGNNAFAASALYDIDIPSSITTIPDELFFNCDNLTSVTIPSHVESIGVAVFASCDGLASFYGNFASADGLFLVEDGVVKAYAAGYNGDFTFPSDVVAIGEGAFYNCGLQWINLADNIHTIGPNALAYNPLGSANIASVKWIGEVAFQGCPYLPEITIPSSVEYIGYGAFANCESLTSVYCTGVTPAGVSVNDDGEWLGFYNTPNLTAIYVPKSDVTTYKSALGWSEYSDIIYDISFAPVSAPAKSSAMASGISAGRAGGKKVCDDRATSINPEARAQHTKGHRMGKDLLVKNFQR